MAQHFEPERRDRRVFYGWWLAGLAMLVNGMASGSIWSGVGVWVKALELFFGWNRTQLTGAFSLAQLEGSFTGPLAGYLIDRLGARRMVLMGLLIVGAGFIIFSRTTNIPVFYLSYAVIMLGASFGTWLPLISVLNKWFIRKRGRAMAIAGEGQFVGGVTLVPLLAWVVAMDHLGWRTTALSIGLVFIAVAWPISRLTRDRPEDYGQHPDGDPSSASSSALPEAGPTVETAGREQQLPDFTAREAMRTPAFWFTTVGQALSAMLVATLIVHLVPMLTDRDLSLQMASYVWASLLAAGAVSQLVGGYLGDRMPKNKVIFGFTTIQAGGFLMLGLVQNTPMAFLFAVMFGMGWGGRIALMTAMRGDYFGQRAFATITGISMAPLFILMLVAPLFAAAMFDIRHSYQLPFVVLAALGSLSGVMFLLAKKPVSAHAFRDAGEAGTLG